MDKKEWQEKLKIYDALIAKCPSIERKGKTMPYTSDNGHMFTLFNKAGEIGIRFGKEKQKEYLEKFETTLYHSYNSVMKGYILIPEKMWGDLDFLANLIEESHKYVCSLPPK